MVFHKIAYNTRNFTMQSFKVHEFVIVKDNDFNKFEFVKDPMGIKISGLTHGSKLPDYKYSGFKID